MKLSIIIPYYNVRTYTDELLDKLAPQITDDIEVILIDDGSIEPYTTKYTWCKVYRQDNGGVSKARNAGIEKSTGEYIAFIDADDLVSEDYIRLILNEIPFDYLDMSWMSFGGERFYKKLNSVRDKLDNPSASTRAFNRAFIGDHRFNENKDAAEDEDFTRHVFYGREANRKVITDFVYFYRTDSSESHIKRYLNGQLKTKRIIYHLPRITKDMSYLVDEIRKEDEHNEVIILTHYNEIPELAEHAQIMPPMPVRGMELRGEPTPLFVLIEPPLKSDIVIWTEYTQAIGGIETWIYNFSVIMSTSYDIVVLYDTMDDRQIDRLTPYVRVVKKSNRGIVCDTLIVSRIADKAPDNVIFNKRVQMVHACKLLASWKIPSGADYTICVSETVKNSFEDTEECSVIKNLVLNEKPRKALLFVSATRLGTFEKGQERMSRMAEQMRDAGIKFVWLCFSDVKPKSDLIIHMPPRLDILPFIAMADYLVQLSDKEGFCLSIVEALNLSVPVITTPLDVLPELGFEENKHGYIVPYTGDMNVKRFIKRPKFKYAYINDESVDKWRDILGDGTPHQKPSVKRMRILETFKDSATNRTYKIGSDVYMLSEVADKAIKAGYAREVKE